jgi:CubicO group peptidase (beta-lactamase class C family)
MLCEGRWDTQTLFSAEYVADATEDYYHPYDGVHFGYGYQFWSFPDLGVYYGWGAYDQKIYVVPDLDLVVVFTADLQGNEPYDPDRFLRDYILPAVDGVPFVMTQLLPFLVIGAVIVVVAVIGLVWFRRARRVKA